MLHLCLKLKDGFNKIKIEDLQKTLQFYCIFCLEINEDFTISFIIVFIIIIIVIINIQMIMIVIKQKKSQPCDTTCIILSIIRFEKNMQGLKIILKTYNLFDFAPGNMNADPTKESYQLLHQFHELKANT